MQIIFFNINHARTDEAGIKNFLNTHKQDTDIFCLQEASDVGDALLDEILSGFNKETLYKHVTDPDTFHLATYYKTNLKMIKNQSLFQENPILAPAIYTYFELNGHPINLLNFHGLSRPVDKLDTPEREKGIQEIVSYFKNLVGLKIIGGDFNLHPTTNSIGALETAGFTNLIKHNNIRSTRNEVVWKLYPENKQYFSDYVFVSNNLVIETFDVPYTEISDHLPLILRFKI